MSSLHELDAPPWRRVESTLMAVSRAIRRAYDTRLKELGLNLTEASLLAYLHERGPLTQTELAERLGIQRAATGAIIDALAGMGLLERQQGTDRRVWMITVCPAAAAVVQKILIVDQTLRDQLRSGIPKQERQQLAETLSKLEQNLRTVTDGP